MMMKWPIKKKLTTFYFYIFLFVGCLLLVRRFNFNTTASVSVPSKVITRNVTLAKIEEITPKFTKNNTNEAFLISNTTHFPLICPTTYSLTQTCPKNTYPTLVHFKNSSNNDEICPDYFKWINEDLKPWKSKGITREMVESGKSLASFRLIIVDGKVYVETYKKSFQTRDVFTQWGILQLLRLYPGQLPDLDMIFECDDKPVIKKSDYEVSNGGAPPPPPMFHYCGDDESFDIPFPDWSFWGWHEINIKPWESVIEDMKEANRRVPWVDRVPYAYWKGNTHMGRRQVLLKCNSTQEWNAQIYPQRWGIESRRGFRQSNVADQCTHRYKIYMEGKAWSVSEKYIQACDSMLLLVTPRYYEFFTRSMVPFKHFWPINPWKKLCESIKFAVDWGNKNPQKAQEIGKAGHKFIVEDLKIKNVYDYMFHLLNEYAKLMRYKPIVTPGAAELCSETMACNAFGKEKQWKIDSSVVSPSQASPCTIPPLSV